MNIGDRDIRTVKEPPQIWKGCLALIGFPLMIILFLAVSFFLSQTYERTFYYPEADMIVRTQYARPDTSTIKISLGRSEKELGKNYVLLKKAIIDLPLIYFCIVKDAEDSIERVYIVDEMGYLQKVNIHDFDFTVVNYEMKRDYDLEDTLKVARERGFSTYYMFQKNYSRGFYFEKKE